MDGDVFVFQINNRSYVALNPLKEEALHSFTICLRTFTDRPGGYGLFEFRSNAPYNSEITVWKSYYKVYILTVGGEAVDFATPDVINQWVHLCFSWGSANGTARAWLDLHPLPRKGLSKGYIIQGTPTIKLGMRRDNPSNDYQQYVGEICHVSMWDYVLSRDEIQDSMFWSKTFPMGNILSWRNLTYNLINNVVVEPF
ncbi:mucosal pentraxin-like [Pleurodeles waltl]|uniref:mucosal pentraxin-like n=1 Tax=Pleurodeles waltl TaxID=8319 RepID=UPI003709C321